MQLGDNVMREFLFESPVLLGVVGLTLAGIAAFIWTQAREAAARKAAFYSMLCLIVMTIVMTLVNIQVKTDQEQIRSMLHMIGAALEKNDLATVFAYIHPNATETSDRARAELPRYRFSDARVTRIKRVEINPSTVPRTAIAEFNVVAEFSVHDTKLRGGRFVRVYLMEKDNRWLARDYEHFEPTAGFRNTALTSPDF